MKLESAIVLGIILMLLPFAQAAMAGTSTGTSSGATAYKTYEGDGSYPLSVGDSVKLTNNAKIKFTSVSTIDSVSRAYFTVYDSNGVLVKMINVPSGSSLTIPEGKIQVMLKSISTSTTRPVANVMVLPYDLGGAGSLVATAIAQVVESGAGSAGSGYAQPYATEGGSGSSSGGVSAKIKAVSDKIIAVRDPIANEDMPPMPDDESIPSEKHIFKLELLKGWNLISNPVYGTSGYTAGLIYETNCNPSPIYHYTPIQKEGDQIIYKGKYVSGSKMEKGQYFPMAYGIWYKANSNCYATITGNTQLTASDTAYQIWLYNGWNHIGAPISPVSFDTMKGDCQVTAGPYKYNKAANRYEKVATLEPGLGYFVKVSNTCQLKSEGDETIPPMPEGDEANPMPVAQPLNPGKIVKPYYPPIQVDSGIKVCSGPRQLVFEMNLDEGSGSIASDISAGRKGTIKNPNWVLGATGGSALTFDGNSYVQIPDESSLSLGDTYLIEAWIKPSNLDSWNSQSPYQTIISKEGEYILRFANGHDEKGNGKIFTGVEFGAGIDQHTNAYLPGFQYSGGNYQGHETSDITILPGKWYKVEMEYDGAYQILRLDGAVISKTKTQKRLVSGSNDLFIGSHVGGRDRFYGAIDNVKIWTNPCYPMPTRQITTVTPIATIIPSPTITATTDFSVSELKVSNSNPKVGDKIAITARITNIGKNSGYVSRNSISFYTQQAGWSIGETSSVPIYLSPGESKLLSFTKAFSVQGIYSLKIEISSEFDTIANNNMQSASVIVYAQNPACPSTNGDGAYRLEQGCEIFASNGYKVKVYDVTSTGISLSLLKPNSFANAGFGPSVGSSQYVFSMDDFTSDFDVAIQNNGIVSEAGKYKTDLLISSGRTTCTYPEGTSTYLKAGCKIKAANGYFVSLEGIYPQKDAYGVMKNMVAISIRDANGKSVKRIFIEAGATEFVSEAGNLKVTANSVLLGDASNENSAFIQVVSPQLQATTSVT